MQLSLFQNESFWFYLYVLKLQNGKFYVGVSRYPKLRIMQHQVGYTSLFVTQNLPIKKYKVKPLDTCDYHQAILAETKLTIRLIERYGIENVYGGLITGNLEKRKRRYSKWKKKGD